MKTIVLSYRTNETLKALPVTIAFPENTYDVQLVACDDDKLTAMFQANDKMKGDKTLQEMWWEGHLIDTENAVKPRIIHSQTGNIYKTVIEAASATGLSPSALSNHLNHPESFKRCKGQTFYRS